MSTQFNPNQHDPMDSDDEGGGYSTPTPQRAVVAPTTSFNFGRDAIRSQVDGSGVPWFNANDICEALGYVNPWQALGIHVTDEDDLCLREVIDSLGRVQQANFVNESGMYALIFGSTKPDARRFKRWVTSEVLPSIRKTGAFGTPNNPQAQYFESQAHKLLNPAEHVKLCKAAGRYMAMEARKLFNSKYWARVETHFESIGRGMTAEEHGYFRADLRMYLEHFDQLLEIDPGYSAQMLKIAQTADKSTTKERPYL